MPHLEGVLSPATSYQKPGAQARFHQFQKLLLIH